ncbi:MAG: DUF1572 family protein [Planctomycetes bacterium]|nr:DUF1572 family protein [Planctomycetota bacterium]
MAEAPSVVATITAILRSQKSLAERGMTQLSDEQFFQPIAEECNSVAIVVKHVAGNLHSRFTDFLTSDGEKPWRNRDTEFVTDDDTRVSLLDRWESGWRVLFDQLDGLTDADLGRSLVIRAEPHSVLQALLRQVSHYGYHVGQIVLIARALRGASWESLSIPKGKSDEFNRSMFGK